MLTNHLQFEIRQLRAHLAQQDLDLAAEREAAMQIHHVWGKQGQSFHVVEGLTPGESDDEGGQRNPREPHVGAGRILVRDWNQSDFIDANSSGESSLHAVMWKVKVTDRVTSGERDATAVYS